MLKWQGLQAQVIQSRQMADNQTHTKLARKLRLVRNLLTKLDRHFQKGYMVTAVTVTILIMDARTVSSSLFLQFPILPLFKEILRILTKIQKQIVVHKLADHVCF